MSEARAAEDRGFGRWRERVIEEVGEAGYERLSIPILEDIRVEPLYTADHPPGSPGGEPDPAGLPGAWPYVRGTRAPGSSPRRWRLGADVSGGDLRSLGEALADDLAGGVDLVGLSLDRAGLPIRTADDLGTLLGVLPEAGVGLALDAGAEFLPALALLQAAMDRAGLEPAAWSLFFRADPLAALAGKGRLPRAMSDLEDEQAALVRHGSVDLPLSRTLGIDLVPYQEAGAHGVQELACAMAAGIHYLRSLADRGVEVGEAAGQVFFVSAVGGDVFLEIAKLRALRAVWSRVLAACEVSEAPAPRIHAVVSRRVLARVDPWNNILRVTTAAFAAAAGGADAVTTVPFDSVLGTSGSGSRRLARATQLILAEEGHLSRVVDPAGGSYYVEWLTDRIARDAWDLMREVEKRGGLLECLATGWVQSEIERTARERARRIATRRSPITGVSVSADPAESVPPAPAGEPTVIMEEEVAVGEEGKRLALADLRRLAANGASLEELSAELAGSVPLRSAARLPLRRDAEPFERLREASARLAERPAVVLLGLGAPGEHRPRLAFAADFFRAGGFEIRETVPGGGEVRMPDPGVPVCCCGSDDFYAEGLGDTVAELKRVGLARVLVAGRPTDATQAVPVDGWIHAGCDAVAVLGELLRSPGTEPGEDLP